MKQPARSKGAESGNLRITLRILGCQATWLGKKMARCEACHQIILAGGIYFFERRFCSPYCVRAYHRLESAWFCEDCLARTDDKAPGNTHSVNGTGTALRRNGEPCPTCLSVPMRKWITFLLIPVLPLKRYLVAWTGPEQYIGRRMVG